MYYLDMCANSPNNLRVSSYLSVVDFWFNFTMAFKQTLCDFHSIKFVTMLHVSECGHLDNVLWIRMWTILVIVPCEYEKSMIILLDGEGLKC